MAVLAGIDEAGFGPILGPLVVSSAAFRVPDNLLWENLWEVLHTSVSDKRRGLTGRLLIADSKKVFNRTLGIRHLRRTVLASLKHTGSSPKNLTELFLSLCPDCLEQLAEYPWYKQISDYPLASEDADIEIAASMLRADLAANHIEMLGLKSRCLEVAHYNRMVTTVNNKAKVLFTAVAELMQSAVTEFKDDNLEIIIDRQGGRSHYRRELQLMFGGSDLRIVREDQQASSYEMRMPNRRVRVHFIVGADSRFLPVSLASMVCKYLREVLMDNINRYFTALSSSVRPTAGYWQDGLRFIADIKTHIPQLKFDSNQLVRCR